MLLRPIICHNLSLEIIGNPPTSITQNLFCIIISLQHVSQFCICPSHTMFHKPWDGFASILLWSSLKVNLKPFTALSILLISSENTQLYVHWSAYLLQNRQAQEKRNIVPGNYSRLASHINDSDICEIYNASSVHTLSWWWWAYRKKVHDFSDGFLDSVTIILKSGLSFD